MYLQESDSSLRVESTHTPLISTSISYRFTNSSTFLQRGYYATLTHNTHTHYPILEQQNDKIQLFLNSLISLLVSYAIM